MKIIRESYEELEDDYLDIRFNLEIAYGSYERWKHSKDLQEEYPNYEDYYEAQDMDEYRNDLDLEREKFEKEHPQFIKTFNEIHKIKQTLKPQIITDPSKILEELL